MSLAVLPSLTPMGRSDAGTDAATRALQALVQMASNADAPLEALVKAVAANNLTTLTVKGEVLQVRLSVALPVGTALTITPAPNGSTAVSVQVKPQAAVAQMAPEAPAQAASAAVVSAMTARPDPAGTMRPATTRVVATAAVPNPIAEPAASAPVLTAVTPASRDESAGPATPPAVASARPAPSDHPEQPTAGMPHPPKSGVATERLADPPRPPAAPQGQPVAATAQRTPTPAGAPVPDPQPPGAAIPAQAIMKSTAVEAPPAPNFPPITPPTRAASPVAAPAPGVATQAMPTAAGVLPPQPLSPQQPVPTAAPAALPQNPAATAAPQSSFGYAPAAMPAMANGATSAGAPSLSGATRAAPIPYATAPRPSTAATVPATPDLARAIATQQPLAPMLADAAKLASDPAMPQPLRLAAQQVVAQALDPTRAPLDAAVLRQAVEGTGVLRPLLPLETPDLGARLTALREVLARVLGSEALPVPADRRRTAHLPLRGDMPHAERSEMVPAGDEPAAALAHRLLAETDGALSRLKLLQAASQPIDGRAPDPTRPAEYRVEVPMILGREATSIQFVFDREAQPQEQKKPRGWRMRFALNVAALGEVGADISIMGAATQVTIWASETETAALIEAMLPDLGPALAARGLEPGAIRMRHGRPGQAAPGRMVDSAR